MIARLGGMALLIALLSALDSPEVPLAFRILLVILWTLTLARPHWGHRRADRGRAVRLEAAPVRVLGVQVAEPITGP